MAYLGEIVSNKGHLVDRAKGPSAYFSFVRKIFCFEVEAKIIAEFKLACRMGSLQVAIVLLDFVIEENRKTNLVKKQLALFLSSTHCQATVTGSYLGQARKVGQG